MARQSGDHKREEAQLTDREKNRNDLFDRRSVCPCCTQTVFFSSILIPMVSHGSHLIYAPDEVFTNVFVACKKMCTGLCEKRGAQDKNGHATEEMQQQKTWRRTIIEWILFVPILILAGWWFKVHGKDAQCQVQNLMTQWAHTNRSLGHGPRFVSISLMMIVRQFVANVLPFTSPAFAYLIAKSQPADSEWMGTLYLLGCSMPAGAAVPFFDKLLSCCGPGDDHKSKFRATRFLSFVTSWLPFSFWVKPGMEKVYAATRAIPKGGADAACAAVCAGHFMIWAGPATTMNQRLFVPDLITCIFIQPLGLMEDVAVVLATWAGEDHRSALKAEISLLIFMIVCNMLHWMSTKCYCKKNIQHVIVMVLTCLAAYYTCFVTLAHAQNDLADVGPTESPELMAAADDPANCPHLHTNTKQMAIVCAKVTAFAFAFRFAARMVTCRMGDPPKDEKPEMGAPLMAT